MAQRLLFVKKRSQFCLLDAVLILAGIFELVLVFILRWKCLIVLVTF